MATNKFSMTQKSKKAKTTGENKTEEQPMKTGNTPTLLVAIVAAFNRTRFFSIVRMASSATLISAAVVMAVALGTEALVSVGSPPSPIFPNVQQEPALAVDAAHPNVLAAGMNDGTDLEACNAGDDTDCLYTPGVGSAGVYFSFDSGHTWIHPTYTGYSARFGINNSCLGVVGPDPGCTPDPQGPIGTVPWYYENGLQALGDPAVAFGPRPDANGNFSWTNGSRLYYANIALNFGGTRGPAAIYVARTDDTAAAAAGDKNAWMQPVLVSRQNSTLFSDKDQIWADNAASSPFFGNVYVCYSALRSRSRGNAPQPVMVAVSRDGGNTWTTKQVTEAATNAQHGFRQFTTIRTDSNGVVYLFFAHFGAGTPGIGTHAMVKSYDGGHNWTRPQDIVSMNDACYNVDPVIGRCVEDGIAGARADFVAAPSVDIANGAPTGADATNEIVDTWVDGRLGLNNEKVMLSYSTNGGDSWSSPTAISSAGDRGFYAAAAISPNGQDLYISYNAFTTPYRTNTSDPRSLVGVVLHADIGTDGVPTGWAELHRSPPGDPRGSIYDPFLTAEWLGDYVYAVATSTYGAAVWNDARNAADCPAVDAWRMSLRGGPPAPAPAPQQDCPAAFGNLDIFGWTSAP
jgi:hypothetical protein